MVQASRISWIDSLKGIAICGVIMIHSGGRELPGFIGKIGASGQYGVQLFFIISAYLAFVSMEKLYIRKSGNVSGKEIAVWWLKKYLKLLPLYVLAILIYIIVEGWGERYWLGSIENITVTNIITHILFLNGFNPYYINSILGVEWYLADLAIFYLIAPFLYKIINTLERGILFLILCSFISYYLSSIAMRHCLIPDNYVWEGYVGTFWFPIQFPVMLIGILLFLIERKWILMWGEIKEKRVLSYCILILSIYLIIGQMYGANKIFHMTGVTLWGICFAGVIFSQFFHKCVFIDNKFWKALGKNSYPIYLVHYLYVYIFDKYIQKGQAYSLGEWALKYLFLLTISYFSAVVAVKLVDHPIQKRIVRKLEKRF